MKEKVIQFGEGGFLRGFADWMIQQVNEQTDFDGKVVVVQPIEKGLCDMLEAQGCKYTHLCRGVEGVDSKTIDVVWNGMTLTEEVKNSMECTNAYCNNAQVVVVNK